MDLEHLHRERALLIAEIHGAFKDVTREGGVSWTEAYAIDDYTYSVDDNNVLDEERAKARALDKDISWQELVDDPKWPPGPDFGGFSFLDAIGYRYYLPATMIRDLRGLSPDHPIEQSSLGFHLAPRSSAEMNEYMEEQLALLDQSQRRCVARYVRFMRDWYRVFTDWGYTERWAKAYDRYWAQYA